MNHPLQEYNFMNYFAFIVYFPLFITGPIISFNGWISQIFQPQNTYSFKDKLAYSFRAFKSFLSLEIFTHICFGMALATKERNEKYFN